MHMAVPVRRRRARRPVVRGPATGITTPERRAEKNSRGRVDRRRRRSTQGREGSGRSPRNQEMTMRYMLIMRATDEAMKEFANVDFNEMLETMGRFNDEM